MQTVHETTTITTSQTTVALETSTTPTTTRYVASQTTTRQTTTKTISTTIKKQPKRLTPIGNSGMEFTTFEATRE